VVQHLHLHLYRSPYPDLVSRFHHPRSSLVIVKNSNHRYLIDGTTGSNSIGDCTTYPRMQQEWGTTEYSTQKDEPKKQHSNQQNYLGKTSEGIYY